MEIGLPEGFPSLSHWLYNQTDTVLQGLVKQGDPQQVIEYSLALITILNEVTHLVLPKRGLQKSLQGIFCQENCWARFCTRISVGRAGIWGYIPVSLPRKRLLHTWKPGRDDPPGNRHPA